MCGPCVPSGTMTQWTTVSFPALIRYCNPQLTSASSRLWRKEEEADCSRATLNPSASEGHIRGPPKEPRRALSGQGSAQGPELLKVFLGRSNLIEPSICECECDAQGPRPRSLFYYGLFKTGDPACDCGTNQSSLVRANASSRWNFFRAGLRNNWRRASQSGAWRGGNKPRFECSETRRDTKSKREWLRVAGKTTLWFYVDFYVTDIKLNAKRLKAGGDQAFLYLTVM